MIEVDILKITQFSVYQLTYILLKNTFSLIEF